MGGIEDSIFSPLQAALRFRGCIPRTLKTSCGIIEIPFENTFLVSFCLILTVDVCEGVRHADVKCRSKRQDHRTDSMPAFTLVLSLGL